MHHKKTKKNIKTSRKVKWRNHYNLSVRGSNYIDVCYSNEYVNEKEPKLRAYKTNKEVGRMEKQ